MEHEKDEDVYLRPGTYRMVFHKDRYITIGKERIVQVRRVTKTTYWVNTLDGMIIVTEDDVRDLRGEIMVKLFSGKLDMGSDW